MLRDVAERMAVGERQLEVRLLSLLARVRGDSGRLAAAAEAAGRAARLAHELDDPETESLALDIHGAVQVHTGNLAQGLDDLRRALCLAWRAGVPARILGASRNFVMALNRAGRPREAVDESAKALAEGRRRGAPSADMGLLALLHIDGLIDVGRRPEAQQCIREAMVLHADSPVTNSLDMLRCVLDVRYGRTSEARRTLDRLRAKATEDRELEPALILLGAELAIALDDVDELRTVLRDAERARLRPGIQLDCLVAMALRLEADHFVDGRAGDPDREQVLQRIERLAQTAGASSVPFRWAMILTADAERTRLDGSAGRADAGPTRSRRGTGSRTPPT